jgi:hypothetical protein
MYLVMGMQLVFIDQRVYDIRGENFFCVTTIVMAILTGASVFF